MFTFFHIDALFYNYQPQLGNTTWLFSNFSDKSTNVICFIFTLHSESCVSPSSAHSALRGDSLRFCTLTHWIISQRQIHMMFASCFSPQWQEISYLIKSRGALLCLDKLLQVLCLNSNTKHGCVLSYFSGVS